MAHPVVKNSAKNAIFNVPSAMTQLSISLDRAKRRRSPRRSTRRSAKPSSRGKSLPTPSCPRGATWRCSWASRAAPCAWPTSASSTSSSRSAWARPAPASPNAARPLPPRPGPRKRRRCPTFPRFRHLPLPFQMGVPAQDEFPGTLWSRILTREAGAVPPARSVSGSARRSGLAQGGGGLPGHRARIALQPVPGADHRRLRRCARASPSAGSGWKAGRPGWKSRVSRSPAPRWPGGHEPVAVPVDDEGLDVAAGTRIAADAALAVVTPGQQAPLGMTMSLARRLALLEWARRNGCWIVEDDYLSELQLAGRAAPALASLDQG
jgi:hypothetical protein